MDYNHLFNTESQELSTLQPPPKENPQTEIMNMLGRILAEVTSLRIEVASIKANVCGLAQKPKLIMPLAPITTVEELKSLEGTLKDGTIFNKFVSDLEQSSEKAFEKYLRNTWRDIMSDEVARQYSWRGTDSKTCIRGMLLTLAVRTAFKNKFSLEDVEFDRITQKYFQYAQDRVTKSNNKKLKQ